MMAWFKKKDSVKVILPSAPKFFKWKFFARAETIVLVSIDEAWIKWIQVEGKPRSRKVKLLRAESILGLTDEQIVEKLKLLFTESGLKNAQIVLSQPSHLTRARALRLPSVDPQELSVMVDLQVEKHTPDTKEETLTCFRVMDSDDQGYSNVLLMMAHQDVVSRSVRMVQKFKSKLIGAGCDVEGLTRWYQHFLATEKEKHAGGTLLIDLDSDYASLLVLHGSEAYYHRSIPLKTEEILQDLSGEALSSFLGEVHRSLMAYEEEGLKGLCSRMVLTGQAVRLSKLSEKIEMEMKLSVLFVPAQQGFALHEKAGQSLSSIEQVSFASLLGFFAGEVRGDLTPAWLKVRQAFEKKVKLVSILGTQILFSLILVSAFLAHQIHEDMAYESFLRSKTKQMEKPASELEVALEHLKIIKSKLEQRGVLLEAMLTIKAATPPEIQWGTFTYEQGGSIVVKGVSRQMAKVFEMVTNLEKSPLFLKPEARRVSKRKVDDKDVTDFELVAAFAGAG